jgi:rubrerythrin
MEAECSQRKLALAAALLLAVIPALGCARVSAPTQTVDTAVTASAPATAAAAETIANLQAAFNGESNANARYTAFAEKADADGYKGVASLFRAAARAEEVHASNHAAVLRSMGAEPTADVKTPDVKSTTENLNAAIQGETYERDTMYPNFIKQAREAGNAAAVRTMNLAMTAENEHAKLYQQALSTLEEWRAATTFYVCTVCGYTASTIDGLTKCPSCFSPKEKFVVVS